MAAVWQQVLARLGRGEAWGRSSWSGYCGACAVAVNEAGQRTCSTAAEWACGEHVQ